MNYCGTVLISLLVLLGSSQGCEQCIRKANRVTAEFTAYDQFIAFQQKGVSKPYKQAGIKTCQDLREAWKCLRKCSSGSNNKPSELVTIERLIRKYCESPWSDGKVCRMADTRICDKLHDKKLCGEDLKRYNQCVDRILRQNGQDCSGVCSPARRYHKVVKFNWNAECKLKSAVDGRCKDYVQLYCFDSMKDTELSWGVFEQMNHNKTTSNLKKFCPVMEKVATCLLSTTNSKVNFFGFDVEKPCSSIQTEIRGLVAEWRKIISPLCSDRPKGKNTVQEVCGTNKAKKSKGTSGKKKSPTRPTKKKNNKKKRKSLKAKDVNAIQQNRNRLVSALNSRRGNN